MKYRHEIFLIPFYKPAFVYRITHKQTGIKATTTIPTDWSSFDAFRGIRNDLIRDIEFRLSA